MLSCFRATVKPVLPLGRYQKILRLCGSIVTIPGVLTVLYKIFEQSFSQAPRVLRIKRFTSIKIRPRRALSKASPTVRCYGPTLHFLRNWARPLASDIIFAVRLPIKLLFGQSFLSVNLSCTETYTTLNHKEAQSSQWKIRWPRFVCSLFSVHLSSWPVAATDSGKSRELCPVSSRPPTVA